MAAAHVAASGHLALPSRVMGERPSMLLPSPARTLHGAINRMFNPMLREFSQESSQGRLCDYRLPSRVMGETEHAAPFPHTHLAWSDLPDYPDALRVQPRVQSRPTV